MKYFFTALALGALIVALLFAFFVERVDSYEGSYAYPAESESECYEDEMYDESEGMCVYVEYEGEAPNAFEESAEEELGGWADEYESEGGIQDEGGYSYYGDSEQSDSESEEESPLRATYRVDVGEKISLVDGTAGVEDKIMWQQIAALSPNAFSNKYIEQYGVFDNQDDDTLAYVHDEDGNGKWIVAINAAGYQSSTPRERATTLVHELGHIVTLNEDQVPSGDEETCTGFFTGEGCAPDHAYITKFVRQFWTTEDIASVGGGAGEGDESLFSRKPHSFVTEYASTNPGEDIAESFALFVLDPQKNASSVAEEKVQSFYAYPELVTFRADMRQALVQGIVRSRKAGVQ